MPHMLATAASVMHAGTKHPHWLHVAEGAQSWWQETDPKVVGKHSWGLGGVLPSHAMTTPIDRGCRSLPSELHT